VLQFTATAILIVQTKSTTTAEAAYEQGLSQKQLQKSMIAGTPFRCAANHLTWLSKDLQMRCDGKVLRNDHEIFNGNLSLQQFWHVFANQINILKPC